LLCDSEEGTYCSGISDAGIGFTGFSSSFPDGIAVVPSLMMLLSESGIAVVLAVSESAAVWSGEVSVCMLLSWD